jgi:hypothetical protein
MKQTDLVLDYMKKNGSISSMEAFHKLGITRLSGRIFELRQSGHKITRITETTTNRYGNTTNYGRYFLGV